MYLSHPVVNHYYEAEVVSEYVIKGNTAVLKCNIPSFVADFVAVDAWIGSDGTEYVPTPNFGTSEEFSSFVFALIRFVYLFVMAVRVFISYSFIKKDKHLPSIYLNQCN